MNNRAIIAHGIKLLVKKCHHDIRSFKDADHSKLIGFKEAQKQIIKSCLRNNSNQ